MSQYSSSASAWQRDVPLKDKHRTRLYSDFCVSWQARCCVSLWGGSTNVPTNGRLHNGLHNGSCYAAPAPRAPSLWAPATCCSYLATPRLYPLHIPCTIWRPAIARRSSTSRTSLSSWTTSPVTGPALCCCWCWYVRRPETWRNVALSVRPGDAGFAAYCSCSAPWSFAPRRPPWRRRTELTGTSCKVAS